MPRDDFGHYWHGLGRGILRTTIQIDAGAGMKTRTISQEQLNRLLDAVALVLARRQMKLYWR